MHVDVAPVEADELADPQTTGVERLEDRAVPKRPRPVARNRGEQPLDSGFGERLGDALGNPRTAELLTRVRHEQPFFRAEAVEGTDRRDGAGHRCGRVARVPVVVAGALELVDVGGHHRLGRRTIGLGPPAAVPAPQVVGVAPQIAAVRGDGVGGQAALDAQPGVVLGEEHREPIGPFSGGRVSGRWRAVAAAPARLTPRRTRRRDTDGRAGGR